MSRNTKATPKRQAVLVLGMHRSGTSALSGVLASLGAKPPRTLLPQAKDNPKGFWESAELMKFHDRILASSGSRWNDWEEFNPDWLDSVVAEQFMDLLPSLIEQEFGDARLLLLKDPRMCRFVPFWLKALERLDISPKVVVPLRGPGEVARSLQVRNGFGPSRAMLMWLRHVLDAESSTRQAARSFIHYDDLLGDWRGQVKKIGSELDIKWPRWSSSVEIEVDNYLSDELRHHLHGDEVAGVDRELLGWIAQTIEATDKLVDAPDLQKDAQAVLDKVRIEFGRSSAIYATVVREHEIKANDDVSKLGRELENSSSKTAELAARLAAANQEVALLSTRDTAYGEAMASLSQDVARRDAEIEAHQVAALEKERLLAMHRNDLESLAQTTAAQARQLLAWEADAAMLKVANAEDKQARAQCEAERESLKASERRLLEFRSQADLRLTEVRAIVVQLGAENRELNVRSVQQANSIEDRYREIAKLTKSMIANEREALEHRIAMERKVGLQEGELEKLRQELALIRRHWSWRMGGPIRRAYRILKGVRTAEDPVAKDANTIRESGWFDAAWYIERYPDVAASGIDPTLHYLEFGALEGRDPSPKFDTNFYVRTYTDVAVSGINPLLHFIQYGQGENREPR